MSTATETPQFIHDCDKCVFLGRYEDKDFGHCDLYYADHGGMPDIVIARWGSDGDAYTYGMSFATQGIVPALVEARRRAIEQGLIAMPARNFPAP